MDSTPEQVMKVMKTRIRKCDKCDKVLANYRSLYSHKKRCKLGDEILNGINADSVRVAKEAGNEALQEIARQDTTHDVSNAVRSIHKTSKKFNCEECGNTFTRKYNLERHQMNRCEGDYLSVYQKLDMKKKEFLTYA